MNRGNISWPVILISLALVVFLSILTFFVLRSNDVKRNIASANAIAFNLAYTGAIFHTTVGNIEIEFLQKDAPKAIYNFIDLAEKKFYDGTKFHYVLKNFLIQGGDPLSRGTDKSLYGTGSPGYTLPEEISIEPMERGIVAMANLGQNTSGSQFFILTAESLPELTGKFTVFAKVVRGFEVLDQINDVPTDSNVPRYPIVLERVEVE